MKNHPSIVVRQLVLVGHRKDYHVPFHTGVNIIYGDSATGKSSILELINYLLGSSKFVYDEEIESSVKYAALEVDLNGATYVIKRDIFFPTKLIEVYQSDFESTRAVFPKKYAPNFSGETGPDGYFSDFLLAALNLPILKVREAPTQAESPMVRLSFRDLFKYCYLKQDDVGSKQLLSLGNWAVHSKNKQTFRYIFNLLDSSITELEQEISKLNSVRTGLTKKYESVSEFLRETEFATEINLLEENDRLNEQSAFLRDELGRLNKAMVADSETYSFLKDTLDVFSTKLVAVEGAKRDAELAIERFGRLKNDYLNDTDKLKAISQARSSIEQPSTDLFNCPICDTEVSLRSIKKEYKIDESDKVNQEVNSLVRRIRDLDMLIQEERTKLQSLAYETQLLVQDREKARRMLDEESGKMITPYLSQRDGLAAELASVNEKIRQSQHFIKVRNQQKMIFVEIDRLAKNIIALEEKLRGLKISAPSISEVMESIGDVLHNFLVTVNIKEPRNVSISRGNFLPVLRGRDYSDITSGGLRTILSIGYYVSLFESAVFKEVNLPPFLMIDTVGKYLGKTQSQYKETVVADDVRENVSDPTKYSNMYEYMISLADRAADKEIPCQIILVDNDVPLSIQQKYAGYVTAHFSAEGENGPVGLIDDAR
jgi:hypothetical protein